jgi:hypothetical protein
MKNKVRKCGVFFEREKVSVKSPRLPRISPQNDHQNTTFCTHFFAKPPVKHRFRPRQKKSAENLPLATLQTKKSAGQIAVRPIFKLCDDYWL